VIEETPAPKLPPDFEVAELWEAAVAIGRHVGYVGAGTCEFVVSSSGVASFLEVNARLQVEHPVTEAVTGLDLVEWQLRVAMGEPLPLSQDEIVRKGSAIEARVYAEDPARGFLPRSGKLVRLEWPSDVRIDSGFDEGDEVGDRYDPLISKVIAMGTDRAEALARLDRALSTTVLLGVVTNLGMLRDVVRNPAFVQGGVTTDWLESIIDDAQGDHPIPEVVMQIAAAAEGSHLASVGSLDPFVSLAGWRLGGGRTFQIVLREATQEETHSVEVSEPVRVDGRQVAKGAPGEWLVDGRTAKVVRDGDAWFIEWESQFYEVGIGEVERSVGADAAKLEAPLPGQVIEVRVSEGEKVAANQPLVIVEAMKMEHTIRAPTDGTVTAVMCAVGQQVNRGQSLVEFDAD
jgi:acetyl/propionyl-CoA carboxylase alpha subunit